MSKRFAMRAEPFFAAMIFICGCDDGVGITNGIPKDAGATTPPPLPEMNSNAKDIAKRATVAPALPR